MNPIQSLSIPTVSPAQLAGQATSAQTDPAKDSTSFKDFLLDSIRDVNSMQQDADKAVEKLVTGGDANPAEVLTAVQKADMAFRMMIQVRNKMVQAYEEVKSIRV
ncbi:MAG TPA: flagellar hook-basal body complex protein FliE [Thermoguttaceae bacterium]|nr:flagellar hook-basal body complex protein FliE [Thermoguttaceae bacterium]